MKFGRAPTMEMILYDMGANVEIREQSTVDSPEINEKKNLALPHIIHTTTFFQHFTKRK